MMPAMWNLSVLLDLCDKKTLNNFISAALIEEFAGPCKAWRECKHRTAIPGL